VSSLRATRGESAPTESQVGRGAKRHDHRTTIDCFFINILHLVLSENIKKKVEWPKPPFVRPKTRAKRVDSHLEHSTMRL